jgi:hypothetical protein
MPLEMGDAGIQSAGMGAVEVAEAAKPLSKPQ